MQAAAEFHYAQQTLSHVFSTTVFQKYPTACHQCHKFCKWLDIPDNFQGIGDTIPFLQIFSENVHNRLMAAKKIPIKKRSVEQYLPSNGKIFSAVGANDPRYNKLGNIDFRLGQQLTTYAKKDPPQTRVFPIPVSDL